MLLTCRAPRFASFSLPKRLSLHAALWLGCLCCLFGSLVSAQASQTLTGKVNLEEVVYPITISSLVPTLTFQFQSTTNGSTVKRSAPLTSNGTYSFDPALPADTYNIAIKSSKWLQAVQKSVVIAANGTTTLADVSVLGGDAIDDNVIDSSDFGLLIGVYGTEITISGSGYDPLGDFNCDGSIDSSDFGILISNFGKVGASLYTVGLASSPTSLVGGGTVQITLTLSNGEPLASSENLMFDCSQAQAAFYTAGTISSPLENHPTVALHGYPASNQQPEQWIVDSYGVYTYQTTFAINTSSVNYPTKITIYGTFLNTRGGVTITLLPTNFHVDSVSMTPPAGANVPSFPKVSLAWDRLTSIDSSQYPLTIKRNGTVIDTVDYNSGSPATSYDDTLAATTFTANQSSVLTYELFAAPASNNAIPVKLGTDKTQLFQISASNNQAVDSRLDLRNAGAPGSPLPYLNFQFGTRTYRGGLFAGHATDPDAARIGHSFIRFPLDASAQPANTTFRAGEVNAYFTGALTDPNQITSTSSSETLIVLCQQTLYDTWNPLSLVWSNAPKVEMGQTDYSATLTYTPAKPAAPPVPATPSSPPQWVAWNMADVIKTTLQSSADQQSAMDLSVLLHGSNEGDSANLWTYFAKKEYQSNLAPCVLYALAFPVPTQINFDGDSALYNTSYTGTVAINGVGIGDSANVVLTIDDTSTGAQNHYVNFVSPDNPDTNTKQLTLPVTGLTNPVSFTLRPTPAAFELNFAHGYRLSVTVTATCNNVSVSRKIIYLY